MGTRIIPKTHHQRSGRSRLILRSPWVALAAIVLALNAAGLPASYAKYKSVCTSAACAHSEEIARLSPEGVRALRDFGLSPGFYGAYVGVVLPEVAVLTFATVAGVIIWHKSDDRMSLFSAFALLVFGGAAFNSDVSEAAAAAYPALSLPVYLLEYVGQVAYTIFFYVFPDGRFVPRWARWLVLVWAVLLVPDVFFPRSPLNLLDGPLFFGLIGGAVLAQAYRYWRVSTPVHRQQTKWVVFVTAVAGAGLVGTSTLGTAVPAIEQSGPLGQMIGTTPQRGVRPPDPAVHRRGHGALRALRDRHHHQPHPRLRFIDGHAGFTLLRSHRSVAESVRLPYRPEVHPGSSSFHPPDRGAVQPLEKAHPVVHRSPLLPQEVRREKDPRSLLCQAKGRDGPRGAELRTGRRGKGDDAACPRLFVAAPRDDL